jgi:2-oxoglutarate dehydrogenase E2 component (dihydrolipoamide succinyltransferase)
MKQDILAPNVGESITEVSLVQWLKSEGEGVTEGEPIAEIESDKATVELTAEASGTIHFTVQEGDVVPVGERAAQPKKPRKLPVVEMREAEY